jgi:ankyrin repeat protein
VTERSGPSPILEAVYRGDDARLRNLLAGDPKLDVFEAAAVGDALRLREVLRGDAGAIAGFTTDGWTSLHLAAFFGRPDAVDVLLAAGADVRAVSRNHEGNMPLHAALAGCGVGRISTTLIAHGADVRATDAGGHTALHHAAFRDDVGLVNTVLAHGADPTARNRDGKTALAIAVERRHAAVARRLRGELP